MKEPWGRGIGTRTALATSATLLITLSSFHHDTVVIPFLAGILALVGVDGTLGESLAQCRGLVVGITASMPLMYPAWLFRVWAGCEKKKEIPYAKCFAGEWTYGYEARKPDMTVGVAFAFLSLIFLQTVLITVLSTKLPYTPPPKFAVLGAVVSALSGIAPHLLWVSMIPPLATSIAASWLPPFDESLAVRRVDVEGSAAKSNIAVALESTAKVFAVGGSDHEDVAPYLSLAQSSVERLKEHLNEIKRLEHGFQIETWWIENCPLFFRPRRKRIDYGSLQKAVGVLQVALRHLVWLVGRAEDYQDNWRTLSQPPRGTLWRQLADALSGPVIDLAHAGCSLCIASASENNADGTSVVESAFSRFDLAFADARADVVYDGCAELIRRDHDELVRVYAFLFDFVRAAAVVADICRCVKADVDLNDSKFVVRLSSTRSMRNHSVAAGDQEDEDSPVVVSTAPEPADKKESVVARRRTVHTQSTLDTFEHKYGERWWHDPIRFAVAIAIGCALGMSPGKTGLNVWLPITVAFVHQRRTSSAFATAKLRLVGTACGAVYGLFAVTWATSLSDDHFGRLWRWLVVIFLFPWIALTCATRHDRDSGYGGLVAGFTPLVIVVQQDAEASFILRLKATMLGAILYLGVANALFPKRAETLLIPELAAMLTALRVAFANVSAIAKPNPNTVRQRSTSQDVEEDEQDGNNPISEDLARLRSVLTEATQLVSLARDEPTYFGYYRDFDAANYTALVRDFGDALLWLDEAATAIVLARQDSRLAAISEHFESFEFLRNDLDRHVDHALSAACRLLESRFMPVAHKNVVKRVSFDDVEKHASSWQDEESSALLVPYTLWRMSKKFSAYNSADTAYIVRLATEQSERENSSSSSSSDPKFSNAAALAYFTFSVVIENCTESMSGIVTDLDRILDDREATRRSAILHGTKRSGP